MDGADGQRPGWDVGEKEGLKAMDQRLVHSDAEMEEVLSTNKEEKRTEEIWGEESIINSIY